MLRYSLTGGKERLFWVRCRFGLVYKVPLKRKRGGRIRVQGAFLDLDEGEEHNCDLTIG